MDNILKEEQSKQDVRRLLGCRWWQTQVQGLAAAAGTWHNECQVWQLVGGRRLAQLQGLAAGTVLLLRI